MSFTSSYGFGTPGLDGVDPWRTLPVRPVTTNTYVTNVYNTTPVVPAADPKIQQDILYGRAMAICALGKARIGGNIIFGPYFNDGKVTFGVSFGVPANVSGTRVAFDIAFDSQVAWRSTAGGTLPADGTFLSESFTFRFYQGTLTQAVDPLETQYFPAEAIAYRPQMLLFIQDLPYARFIKPVPYVACLIGDTTGGADPDDGINLGTALERVAHSPWSGYTLSTFDAENVTDVVEGLLLKDNFTVVEIVQSITRGYKNLDLVQADKLYVRDHGSDVYPDFIFDLDNIVGGTDAVMITRGEPSAQPRELELVTVDPDQDYTEVASLSKRARDPLTVSVAAGKDSFSMPLVMDASTRQAIVTYSHYYEENARKRVQFTATAEGYEIEPGDMFALINIADGIDDEVFKAIETLHAPNYTVEITGEAILRCGINYEPIGTFQNFYESGAAGPVYTISSVDLGAEASDRLIVLLVTVVRSISASRAISSVTINGVTATIHENLMQDDTSPVNGSALTTALVSAVVPTGTSVDVVVTADGTASICCFGVYRFTGLASNLPYDSAIAGSNNSDPALTLNVPPNGFVVSAYFGAAAGVGNPATGSATWTGLSTIDRNAGTSATPVTWASLARQDSLSAQTGRAISVTASQTSNETIVAASFG